ncbi:MAG: proton-conducting membrane transporter [Lachnospiraceae bacterium]|nr:proton-conducting membrane transporter [Lachnospiraceae bacterium]
MSGLLILLSILFPILAGVLLFLIKPLAEDRPRNIYVACALAVSSAITLLCLFTATGSITLWSITENVSIGLHADRLSKIFGTLMSLMFTVVGIYAMGYMEHEEHKNRFFAFYLMVFGVLNGIYLASNLLTMYLFYEMMTLISLPLVLHELTAEAIDAGKKYLYYSIAGAFLSLVAIFLIYTYAGSYNFVGGGIVDASKVAGHENLLLAFVLLAIIGFGCKAGLFPLHDWLPTAHPVAPAPASAVLSGVITKSGVIAIIRVVFYSVGADFIRGTWVQYTWIILTLVTVFLGSMMAYLEKGLKKRLAYSSVSQVSYVLFGLSTLHPLGFLGALLHVIFHSIIKDDLFLVAGAIIHQTGITVVDGLKAIGKRMPLTIWGFTFASLALIGIPPFTGFVSKWFLCSGALDANIGAAGYIGPVVLLVSALLTAGYLLPITIDGFFPGHDFDDSGLTKCEPAPVMLVPILVLSLLALVFGIFPGFIERGIMAVVAEIGL